MNWIIQNIDVLQNIAAFKYVDLPVTGCESILLFTREKIYVR